MYAGGIAANGGSGIAGNPTSSGSGSGNVTGPSSAVVNNLASYSASTGQAIADSGLGAVSVSSNVGLNTTAGIYQNASLLMFQQNTSLGSLAIGFNAGAALPSGAAYGAYFGWGAGQNVTGATAENAFFGCIAGQYVTTGQYDTALGQHALGYETTGSLDTAVGNDCMRNVIGVTGSSFCGAKSGYLCFASEATGLGAYALRGNSAAITLTGSVTTGDTITLTFTSTAIGGGSAQAAYTTVGGDTLATVTTNLTAAIEAVSAITAAVIGATVSPFNTTGIVIDYPGTSAIGVTLTITSSVSGAATEIVTITGGVSATAYDNIAIGYQTMYGGQMTTATHNYAIGGGALPNLTTGSYNIAFGNSAGLAITTGINNLLAGYNTGWNITTGGNNVGLGFQTLQALTTLSGATVIGAFGGQNATNFLTGVGYGVGRNLTSGAYNCAFGYESMYGAASSTASNNAAFGDYSLTAVTSAAGNSCFGYKSGLAITSGGYNILIGWECATNFTTGSNNIIIASGNGGYTAANTSNTLWIGANGGTYAVMTATSLNTTPLVSIPGGSLTLGTASTVGGTLILEGSTSGSVTVEAPATAGTTTVTLTHAASGQTSVAAPTAPASTSAYTMQGLAGSITPATSGTVLIMISGTVVSPTGTAAGNGIQYQISYGTSTAPTNGAALTGTQIGTVQEYTNSTTVTAADVAIPFSVQAVVTGLTKGTAYWLDLAAESIATASDMGLAHVSVTAIELI